RGGGLPLGHGGLSFLQGGGGRLVVQVEDLELVVLVVQVEDLELVVVYALVVFQRVPAVAPKGRGGGVVVLGRSLVGVEADHVRAGRVVGADFPLGAGVDQRKDGDAAPVVELAGLDGGVHRA